MSNRVSVLIPSRTEPYLVNTIDDVFRNARGDLEVVVSLDGYWPDNWAQVVERHKPRLHTVHFGEARGMRNGINGAAASAISRGAEYLFKLDAHCKVDEGFDLKLAADCDRDWIAVPRRKRLDVEKWAIQDVGKPDVDYHYLSFPDDPNDFGGKGLNGKVWYERIRERLDKPEYEIDDEMSSQGSAWFMHSEYFQRMGFMDEASYGPFWNEFQELGLCCWLSGGQVKINKRTWYAHWHKGKAGRQYRLSESWLKLGRDHTMKWIFNEAWDQRQTRPFEWLIDHFWPVPTWSENWREVLYAERKPKPIGTAVTLGKFIDSLAVKADDYEDVSGLRILYAKYGIRAADGLLEDGAIEVTKRVQSLVVDDCLDIRIDNSTIAPGQNPFRGVKKTLEVAYSFDGAKGVRVQRDEKEILIIGRPTRGLPTTHEEARVVADEEMRQLSMPTQKIETQITVTDNASSRLREVRSLIAPRTAAALNDFLIRRFNVSSYRLRAPMPIELPNFHRNDLAQLFAELGFTRGAEIGVAEGNYSEVLLKANPTCELLLVDPWHAYSDNPQNKTKERHEYAYRETLRKIEPYLRARPIMKYSMDAVRDVEYGSLDFCYVDGNHLFDHAVMDVIEWSKRVRSGGLVCGDDFYQLDQKRWIGGGR